MIWEQEIASSIPSSAKFFQKIDDSHCDRIISARTAVRRFDNGFVGK